MVFLVACFILMSVVLCPDDLNNYVYIRVRGLIGNVTTLALLMGIVRVDLDSDLRGII